MLKKKGFPFSIGMGPRGVCATLDTAGSPLHGTLLRHHVHFRHSQELASVGHSEHPLEVCGSPVVIAFEGLEAEEDAILGGGALQFACSPLECLQDLSAGAAKMGVEAFIWREPVLRLHEEDIHGEDVVGDHLDAHRRAVLALEAPVRGAEACPGCGRWTGACGGLCPGAVVEVPPFPAVGRLPCQAPGILRGDDLDLPVFPGNLEIHHQAADVSGVLVTDGQQILPFDEKSRGDIEDIGVPP